MKDPLERFWSKVQKTDGCWLWTASCYAGGYGAFCVKWDGRFQCKNAHRWAWILNFGDIPEDIHVLHKCDNRKCVRLDHLFLGTPNDNIQDMISKGRERHPANKLTPESVLEIFRLVSSGVTNKHVGKQFGITDDMVSLIIRRKAWKSVYIPEEIFNKAHNYGSHGSRGGSHKLTESQVCEILQEQAKGYYQFQDDEIAKRYGVDHCTINKIRHGKCWTHITRPIPELAGIAVPKGEIEIGI